MKAISILGLGWLGLPLADLFIQKAYSVAGTTRCPQKREKISNTSLSVVEYGLYEHSPSDLPIDFFNDSVLVLNIPPGRKNLNAKAYADRMLALIDHAFTKGLKQLIFISTTSVFGNISGKVKNSTATAPQSDSAKAHVAIEEHIKDKYYDRACIIRPAGLVGPNHRKMDSKRQAYRHPIFSLVNRQQLDSGDNPVNLVHQEDLVKVIAVVVDNEVCASTFNVATLTRATRRDYYVWCAKQLGLPSPNFIDKGEHDKSTSGHKFIDVRETLDALSISLSYPSPFDLLPEQQK